MCKHVAAVLYGVGARLDTKPELLFTLRGVNHEDLIQADAEKAVAAATSRGRSKRLAAAEVNDVFGIEIDSGSANRRAGDHAAAKKKTRRRRSTTRSPKRKTGTSARKKSPKAKGKTTRSASKKPVKKKAIPKKATTKKAVTRAA